jgi:hypothetical protein
MAKSRSGGGTSRNGYLLPGNNANSLPQLRPERPGVQKYLFETGVAVEKLAHSEFAI